MLNKLKLIEAKLPPGLLKIIHNVGWLYLERVVTILFKFLIGIYVIRYLGAENFGKISYGISFVSLFTAIAKLGLDAIVVRNLVKEEESSTNEILGTAFILKLFSSFLTIVLISLIVWRVNDDAQTREITILLAFSLIYESFEVIDFWFQSQVQSKSIAIIKSLQLISTSLGRLVLILLKSTLLPFVLINVAASAVNAIGFHWVYLKQNKSIFKWKFNWHRAINMLKDSLPLIFAGVMIAVYVNIDQVMLNILVDSRAVGIYAAAVRFSEIWYFIPVAICSSVFPTIIRAKQRSEQEYQKKIQQLYDFMAWISLIIAVPMTFASTPLVKLLLGNELAPAGSILALHIWAGPFVFLGVARSQWLMTENFTQLHFVTTFLGALSNIFLNYYLIPLYSGTGAAIATVISYGISSHLSSFLFPKIHKNTWMLTKALFIPLRIRQNFAYLNLLIKAIF
jgi:O-antigen/teichoic acid export membrane protein